MPEGPSIVILKEKVQDFTGKRVIAVSGNSKADKARLLSEKVISVKSWGKHFLLCFKGFTLKVHLLMFGSYLINERKAQAARLSITFDNGELNLYSCSVKILEGDIDNYYDWSVDVMNDAWVPVKARKKLEAVPNMLICDALLDKDIFAGVGNIIKNEVLYRVYVHPESKVGKIPANKLKEIIKEARNYSFEFLEWKRQYELRKHWLAHTKKICLRCNLPIIRKVTGAKRRRSFFCLNCQELYK
ncbi:MAG TPA: DNA-formamidopyrimidine glycosylase family protein [Bacteroidia bacterium]|jgi:endonuclease-8|nr:DNA-formamidopyrimidine glycosylase family protein [Bacteroidia bacterium]